MARGFNVALGMHESVLNDVMKQVFHALDPELLKREVDIDGVGFSSLGYELQGPPVVTLEPSEKSSPHNVVASSAGFTIKVSNLALTINYSSGESPNCFPSTVLELRAIITVDADSNLRAKILSGTVTIPEGPGLTTMLNRAIVPFMIKKINEEVLPSIKIPPLRYKSLHVSAPLPVVQRSHITAFSALGSTPASIPAPLSWPTDGIYIAVDIPAIQAATDAIFPKERGKKFKWKIFSGRIGVVVKKPRLYTINSDGSIGAHVDAEALCLLEMRLRFCKKVSLGPRAVAGANLTFRSKIEDNVVKIVPAGIPIFTFSFDMWRTPFTDSIKTALSKKKEKLFAEINSHLAGLIGDIFEKFAIPVYTIDPITISFGKRSEIKITLDSAKPSELKKLLVNTTKVTVSSKL